MHGAGQLFWKMLRDRLRDLCGRHVRPVLVRVVHVEWCFVRCNAVDRHFSVNSSSATGRRRNAKTPGNRTEPLTHALEAQAGASCLFMEIKAVAVIANFKDHPILSKPEEHIAESCSAVLRHVCKTFLSHAEQNQCHLWIQSDLVRASEA